MLTKQAIRIKSKKLWIVIIVTSILVGLTIYLVLGPARALLGSYLFRSKYLGIMKDLNDSKLKADIRANLSQSYNFTDLYEWEWTRLRWVPENETFSNRPSDPRGILLNGKGRCEEFSILFVSASLALGYDARLVVAENIDNWSGLHVWAEAKDNGSWIQVDPSDRVWNQTSHYETWEWWKDVGLTVRIYAFENGKCEDITAQCK